MKYKALHKNIYIIIILVVVALALGSSINFYLRSLFYNTANGSSSVTSEDKADDNTTQENNQTTKKSTNYGTTSSNLSYADALNIYGDRRIQFSLTQYGSCVLTPSSMVLNNGTDIMFDNRIDKSITFSLDGNEYSVKALGFRILTMKTTYSLPHSVTIDCYNGRNNGTITLQ